MGNKYKYYCGYTHAHNYILDTKKYVLYNMLNCEF